MSAISPRTATSCSSACAATSSGATCRVLVMSPQAAVEDGDAGAAVRRDGLSLASRSACASCSRACARSSACAARSCTRATRCTPRRPSSRGAHGGGEAAAARRHPARGARRPLADEIYRILARRVARALEISHCSVILARPGDAVGIVAAAYETPGLQHLEIQLERYPEIRAALETSEPVLVEDVRRARCSPKRATCGRSRATM